MKLLDKTVTVGVTGGIAAFKSCELVSRLKKEGADVFVVMSKNATNFVSPLTFETLSSNRVVSDMFDRNFRWEVEHISLAKKTDIFVVAPATANFVAKLACGIADDFLTTTAMAMKCPVLLAPAMNTAMLQSAAYKENEEKLKGRGVSMIFGGSGLLACGDVGAGRMAEPEQILEKITEILCPKNDYMGKTVLVTAGGTSEPIDPVRYITNRSSGKMGIAIAEAAKNRGAQVVLVLGKISVPEPKGIKIEKTETTMQMFDAVMQNMQAADIIIKAAAPSDYRVENFAENKIKGDSTSLKLVKNPDIAAEVGKKKGNKKLVIFCAETQDLISSAQKKLKNKNADLVVANDVTMDGAGFNCDTNIVTLISNKSCQTTDKLLKTEIADLILDKITEL